MAHKRVADVIVETLQAAGVKHCWGVPGDTLNFVTDAIRRSDIAWVHVRHEEVGGFAAGAEAMLTGRLTACEGDSEMVAHVVATYSIPPRHRA
jgi:pyruvate dehydrogenase (quinone)